MNSPTHVIATAGHVDHGKTSLVDALTGMRSDRLPEERLRAVSIELGYVWTHLEGLGRVAFVDVPGHERYIATTLRGLAPCRAVLLVVSAEDPWMPQATEHLAALDAFGVKHGVVAITKCDRADPGAIRATIEARLAPTSLVDSPIVEVSAQTGQGLEQLRAVLGTTLGAMQGPDLDADVRLWVDRKFAVDGRGTVVTGTLEAGTIRTGDVLQSHTEPGRIREVHVMGTQVASATGPTRVALNIAGKLGGRIRPGDPLVTPGAWPANRILDVRLEMQPQQWNRQPIVHLGTYSGRVTARRLGARHARITFPTPVPSRPGDRAVLRSPGDRSLIGIEVLDPLPPPQPRRRGWASTRAAKLDSVPRGSSLESELDRRGYVSKSELARLGIKNMNVPLGSQTLSSGYASARFTERVHAYIESELSISDRHPGAPDALTTATKMGLPDVETLSALIAPHFRILDGKLSRTARHPKLIELHERLNEHPSKPPDCFFSLREILLAGYMPADLFTLVHDNMALELDSKTFILHAQSESLLKHLSELSEPWSVSEARRHLQISRAATLRLLHHLEASGTVHVDRHMRRSMIAW